jgi:TRAP-type C4-dicarboxylate transport system permease small subunit
MSLKRLVGTIPSYVGAVGVIGISVTILAIIATRNAGVYVSGLLSLAQITCVWVIFLLIGGLARERRHIQIDYFADRLPEPYDEYHEWVLRGLNLVACFVFLYSALFATLNGLDSVVGGLGVPTAVYFAAPLLGFIMLTIVYAGLFAELLGIENAWTEAALDD